MLNLYSNAQLYWLTKNSFTVPYVPYVSNCEYQQLMIFPSV